MTDRSNEPPAIPPDFAQRLEHTLGKPRAEEKHDEPLHVQVGKSSFPASERSGSSTLPERLPERSVTTRPRINGGDVVHSDFKATTPLQSIAQQILRLTYHEHMSMSKNLHADSSSVGKSAHEVAELVHAWATREVEGKNNNTNEHSTQSSSTGI
jgi:hypothetical protein